MVSTIYTKDWFNRSGDYILKNEDLEIGFCKTPQNQYSRFLYDEHKAELICSDIKRMMSEMNSMISVIGLRSIRFKLSKNVDTACTDGKTIYVGIGKNYKNVTDIYEKLDRVIGMTIHECCHCLYTDFNYIQYALKGKSQLIHHLHNVIEDEMIENRLCVLYPGYGNFLAKLKYNIFEKEADNTESDNSEINKILEILFYVIRYPKLLANISEDDFKKYESLFFDIQNIMKTEKCFDLSNKECTKSSVTAALRIYELLEDYIEKNNISGNSSKNSEDNEDDSNNSQSSNNSEENSNELNGSSNETGEDESEDNGNDENNESSSNSSNNTDEDESNESDVDNTNETSETTNDADNNDSDEDSDMVTPEIIDENDEDEPSRESTLDDNGMSDIMNNINENDITSTSENPISDKIFIEHTEITKNEYEENVITEWNTSDFKKNNYNTSKIRNNLNENKKLYNEYYNDIKSYIPIVRKIIIPNNKSMEYINERYRRNGSLDPTRLANAMCNEQTVYTQKSFKITNNDPKYALVILIDESGSMEDMNINIFASKMAILFYEAFRNYPNIKLFVYGHGDCIYRYIDTKNDNKYVLGERHSQWSQNEVMTYNAVIEDVKAQTNLPIVVFNLTDSLYCSNEENLKNCVETIKNTTEQKVSFNLFVLRGAEFGCCDSKEVNDNIYGKGHYVTYNHKLFKPSNDATFIYILKEFGRIIISNFNKRTK